MRKKRKKERKESVLEGSNINRVVRFFKIICKFNGEKYFQKN